MKINQEIKRRIGFLLRNFVTGIINRLEINMKVLKTIALDAITCEANKTGAAIDLNGIYGFFLQWQLTNSPTGNIVVQASADGTNYYDVSTTAVAVGFVNLDAQFYQFMRVKFARTTGLVTDLISAQVFCKGV